MKNTFVFVLVVAAISSASFAALINISFADVAIVCSQCYVNSCQCVSNCTSGTMYVYNAQTCTGIFAYSYNVSNGISNWQPPVSQNYSLRILCDDGNQSSCNTVFASVPVTTTTTTTSGGSVVVGGCIAQGYCYYSSQCCNSLSCINNTCSRANVSVTTTTTSTALTTSQTTETTSTTIVSTTTTPVPPFIGNVLYTAIVIIVLVVIIIAVTYFFLKGSKNRKATDKSKDEKTDDNAENKYEKLKKKWEEKDHS